MKHFIACIGAIDDEDQSYEGVFLKETASKTGKDNPIFVVDEEDEASFPKSDVILKLPASKFIGGSARRNGHLCFNINLPEL